MGDTKRVKVELTQEEIAALEHLRAVRGEVGAGVKVRTIREILASVPPLSHDDEIRMAYERSVAKGSPLMTFPGRRIPAGSIVVFQDDVAERLLSNGAAEKAPAESKPTEITKYDTMLAKIEQERVELVRLRRLLNDTPSVRQNVARSLELQRLEEKYMRRADNDPPVSLQFLGKHWRSWLGPAPFEMINSDDGGDTEISR